MRSIKESIRRTSMQAALSSHLKTACNPDRSDFQIGLIRGFSHSAFEDVLQFFGQFVGLEFGEFF